MLETNKSWTLQSVNIDKYLPMNACSHIFRIACWPKLPVHNIKSTGIPYSPKRIITQQESRLIAPLFNYITQQYCFGIC